MFHVVKYGLPVLLFLTKLNNMNKPLFKKKHPLFKMHTLINELKRFLKSHIV